MKLLTMDKPLCLLYSAAMVLDEEPEALISEIGHDGMEIWWPEFKDDRQYRAHNISEIIDCCFRRNKALMPIQGQPLQAPPGGEPRPTYDFPIKRFLDYLFNRRAIMIGQTALGNGHAWAWDGTHHYDPRGEVSADFSGFIRTAWILTSL